ncbi:UNVERIFIED_CONTAM: hypothetical protein N8J90_18295 [Halobacillus marinus]|uniref:hypothetical protein n=1 Tax=Bacillus sp. SB49 TaxID=1071080 RepID=UPI000782E555|nr:hypothetical protein [Bacillus sp. SB49]QHT48076.1 hypothetical protein M662_16850 [Bacillus sp. SB49]
MFQCGEVSVKGEIKQEHPVMEVVFWMRERGMLGCGNQLQPALGLEMAEELPGEMVEIVGGELASGRIVGFFTVFVDEIGLLAVVFIRLRNLVAVKDLVDEVLTAEKRGDVAHFTLLSTYHYLPFHRKRKAKMEV